ncbi:MAG: membrane complex biogenesis BtpA family protein [Halobacteriales archaeon]|jgi:membrane complex biogenesis BtpA family protein
MNGAVGGIRPRSWRSSGSFFGAPHLRLAVSPDFISQFEHETPIIGVVHLPALPGAPESDGDRSAIRQQALADATALENGGVDAIIVENFGDAPFYPDEVPAHVVADMTAVTGAVVAAVGVPVGVNVLRNDATAALSVAAAAGADFVRVNVHVGVAVTDQGTIEGRAHETLRLRDRIDTEVAICADVGVKHAAALADRDLSGGASDAVERGLADAVIVSGERTGDRTSLDDVRYVQESIGETVPVLVGSGVTAETAPDILQTADGAIVGTAFKTDGVTTNPVEEDRVRELVDAAKTQE